MCPSEPYTATLMQSAPAFPVSYQGVNGGYGIMEQYKMDKSLLGSYDVSALITILHVHGV